MYRENQHAEGSSQMAGVSARNSSLVPFLLPLFFNSMANADVQSDILLFIYIDCDVLCAEGSSVVYYSAMRFSVTSSTSAASQT